MFSITINGNTLDELYNNIKTFRETKLEATFQMGCVPTQPATPPAITAPPAPAAPTLAAATPPPVATVSVFQTAAAPPAANAPVFQTAATPPAAAPTYTLDQLARAGATLAQSGKMEQALALLAKYGVQTVNQLKPEQYGAFATELRALGAQV